MKRILILAMVSVLAACSSTNKDIYEKRADDERQRQERYTERAIDKAPKWMTDLPKSNSAVYSAGSATSPDFGMADEKAKTIAFGNICMAAGGEVNKSSRVFRADIGEQSVEHSKTAIRSMCRTVDISGAEVVEIKRLPEGNRFRSFVLVALPTGSANAIQQRRDQLRAQRQAEQQSDRAFKELDDQGKRTD